MSKILSFSALVEKYFLQLAFFVSVTALIQPYVFVWIKPHIPLFLGIIMFGMGLTLKFTDFEDVWRHRQLVLLGAFLQYTIMPILALLISFVFHLPREATIGLVIVGSCPGGTASNVITYLARANVALSVVMTMTSTLLAPLVTPGIIYIILSQQVDIPFWSMVRSVLIIVALPVFGGLVIRHFFMAKLKPILTVFPSISIIAITLVIACVVALNQKTLLAFPFIIIFAVVVHNLGGLMLGYTAARLLRCDEKNARTLAIEVGMQNSGLGVALANQFFSAASALPGAIFSLWHNLSGISLAKYWAKR